MINKTLLADPQAPVFSRELSWLAFNDRVLDEAADSTNPLLERLKFLVIVSTNLEEFFMIRVAYLFRKQRTGRAYVRDGVELSDLLKRIRDWVLEQKLRQARLFEEIARELGQQGLCIESGPSPLARETFEKHVLPNLVPVRILENDPLPTLRGGKLFLLAKHSRSYSLIEIPPAMPRLWIVKTRHIFLFERLVQAYREEIFAKQEVQEIVAFKVSRDAEIEIDDEADDPLKEVEDGILDRESGSVVRVEVDALSQSPTVDWLRQKLEVDEERMYQVPLPLDLRSFMALTKVKRFRKLLAPLPAARRPELLPAAMPAHRFYRSVERNDILFHHPFTSFDPVVELVQFAAHDPKVTRICQTLYRAGGESPIVEALIHAAQAGKKVTALVEIKARFDEANNIRWARALERAGARVIYGTADIKVHAKLTYVEKKILGRERSYVHISTGNYHPRTARLYTDLGLMTTHPGYCADARHLFDLMEKMDADDDYSLLDKPNEFSAGFKTWTVAPKILHERVIEWIDLEIANARAGRPAGIRAKMNGLVEQSVVEALYRASEAGVPIDLFVRSMNCARPHVTELSSRLRVRSIVDKYLEHSRVFIFENGGDRRVWLSSADWMPRNFFRRVEIAFPILNPGLRDWIAGPFWENYDRDNVRARECLPDGRYERIVAWGQPEHRAQLAFEKLSVPSYPAWGSAPSSSAKHSPAPSPANLSKE